MTAKEFRERSVLRLAMIKRELKFLYIAELSAEQALMVLRDRIDSLRGEIEQEKAQWAKAPDKT